MLVSARQKLFFYGLKLIEVYSHPLICLLLCPKVSTKKNHYYKKILGELILLIMSDVLVDLE